MSNEEMQYTVRLKDEASAHQEKIRQGFRGITNDATSTSRAIGMVQDKLGGLVSWIKAGFGGRLGSDIFGAISRGLGALIDMIPNAIELGRDYAQTLKDIQRITGMTAQDTSIYAGILGRIGIPLTDVQRTLAMFGRNLIANEDLLNQLGIATRNENGALLDAATVLDNARRQFNQYGSSLQATGAAQELFSRTGYKFLEFLQLSDDEVRQITGDLQRWGLVLDQSVLDAAERSNRALNNLHQGFEAIQTTIFAALEPTLTSFVTSFANFIQQNMQAIVSFAVNATNFVLGLIGGLLGIDFTPIKAVTEAAKEGPLTFEQWKKGQTGMAGAAKGTTSAVSAQIKAIDAQIDAIRRRAQARQDANRAEELALNLAKAQQQLEDLRSNSPFVAGLNNAEQQLALQKHAADIADAEKGVAEARKAINEDALSRQERAEIEALQRQKDRLQAVNQAARASVNLRAGYAQYLSLFTQQQSNATASNSLLNFDKINEAAEEWRDKGVAFAGDLKKAFGGVMDVLFGPNQWHQVSAAGSGYMQRSGGLIGGLGQLAAAAEFAGGFISGAASVIVDGVSGVAGFVRGVFTSIADFAGDVANFVRRALGLPAFTGKFHASTAPGALGSTSSGSGSGSVVVPHGAVGAASGGVARARPGGSLWRLGEGGEDEGAFTESQLALLARAGFGGAGGDGGAIELVLHNHIHLDGREIMKLVNRELYYQANRQPAPLVAA